MFRTIKTNRGELQNMRNTHIPQCKVLILTPSPTRYFLRNFLRVAHPWVLSFLSRSADWSRPNLNARFARAQGPDHSGPPGKKSQTLVAGWVVTSVILEGHCLRYPELSFMDSGSFWGVSCGKNISYFPLVGYKRKQSRIWATTFLCCADRGPSY